MTYLHYDPPSTPSIDGDVKINSGIGHDDKKIHSVLEAGRRNESYKMPQLIRKYDVCENGIYRSSQQPFFSIGTYEAVEPLNDVRVAQSEAAQMNKLPQRSKAKFRRRAFD